MYGIVLAMGSALLWAALDTERKFLSKHLSALLLAGLLPLLSAFGFAAALFFTTPLSMPKTDFWWIIPTVGILQILANLLFFRSLQLSPLSLTVPYLSFTPAFMLLTGFLFLAERPSWGSLLGTAVVILGAILLNLPKGGGFQPFRTLLSERGSLYMLIVALIWATTGPLEKRGIQASSTLLYAVCQNLAMSVPLLLYLLLRRRQAFESFRSHLPLAFLAAATMLFAMYTQFLAIQQLHVVYVDTLKRSGALFAVLSGAFFFKEQDIKRRLLGATVMVAGVLLTIWSQPHAQ